MRNNIPNPLIQYSPNTLALSVEVWDGPEGPQVWHKKENTNRLPLQKVLSVISNNAFSECE